MSERTISKNESTALLASSLVVAAAALLVTVIVARAVSPAQASEFVVFWGLLFGVYGVLTGIQQEVTRAVGSVYAGYGNQVQGARVLPVALVFGAVAALLMLALGFLGGTDLLPSHTLSAFALIALAAFLYSGQSASMGAAAGSKRWYLFAAINGGDAAFRLIFVVAALAFAGLVPFYLATTVSVLLWLLLGVLPAGRRNLAERADVSAFQLARKMGFTVVSSSANAVLVTGFPVLLQLAMAESSEAGSAGREGLLAAVVFAITVTRSPIMIPLQAFQGVAISAFLKQQHRPLAALKKPVAALMGIAALGGLLAWLIGPWLFALVFGSKYDGLLEGWFLGTLTFASGFMAVLMITGAATLAVNRHIAYTLGWVVAALVAIALMFVPQPVEIKTLLALYGGPLAGLLIHFTALRHHAKNYRSDRV